VDGREAALRSSLKGSISVYSVIRNIYINRIIFDFVTLSQVEHPAHKPGVVKSVKHAILSAMRFIINQAADLGFSKGKAPVMVGYVERSLAM